jgi:hypothetical protein
MPVRDVGACQVHRVVTLAKTRVRRAQTSQHAPAIMSATHARDDVILFAHLDLDEACARRVIVTHVFKSHTRRNLPASCAHGNVRERGARTCENVVELLVQERGRDVRVHEGNASCCHVSIMSCVPASRQPVVMGL